jgi:hypothetical protein
VVDNLLHNRNCDTLKIRVFKIIFLQNQRTGGQNRSYLGIWYQWERGNVGKEYRRVNIMQIPCAHVCKWKNKTC